jgi:hypothetical protein
VSADEALLALERRVLRDSVVLEFTKAVNDLRIALATESPDTLALLLAITPPDVTLLLQAAINEAHDLGTADAIDALREHALTDAQRARLLATRPPETLLATAQRLTTTMADDIAKAKLLANAGADITAAVSPALAAGNRLANTATWAVNSAGNTSVRQVADIAELPTVWVAETDACVHCLAYSGRVCHPGAQFPGGLTYGAKSYYPESLETPPLHGRCRCRLEVLRDTSYADSLRREADRSVLRGFSLPSESMGVRIAAAQRLIGKGVDAPKSVLAFSRRAIKAGKFPTRGR